MTDDLRSPLGKMQGPLGDPNTFERQAKALRRAGGALLLQHHMDELPAPIRAEIEKVLDKAWGKASRPIG